MLNNYKYNEYGSLEVTVTIPTWYTESCAEAINQPDNEYYIRCGNVIASVPTVHDVITAILAELLGQRFVFTDTDLLRAINRMGGHDIAELYNKDEPKIIKILSNVWVSNDRQIIEEVQTNPDDRDRLDGIEKMFLAITGQERL